MVVSKDGKVALAENKTQLWMLNDIAKKREKKKKRALVVKKKM